jgi:hypothetical protein
MSKERIRRALDVTLKNAMEAAGVECFLGLEPIPDDPPEEYVRGSPSFGRDNATEIGQDPRIERGGRYRVAIYTNPRLMQDRNDEVARLVRAAFPYGVDLVYEGIRVNILTIDDSECLPDGSYLFSPLYVNFMVWSTTNV